MRALRPLLVLGILITASGFASDILGDYLGPIDYKGYLVFDYPEGENPINNIVFTVDSTLADNLIIVSVPSIWSYNYASPVLTLSGGSVGPGGSVSVTVSLNKYFEDGEYAVSSVGTTITGEISQASGPLLVGELTLLNVIGIAFSNRYALTGATIGIGFLELFLSGRKRNDVHGVGQGELVKGYALDDQDTSEELKTRRARDAQMRTITNQMCRIEKLLPPDTRQKADQAVRTFGNEVLSSKGDVDYYKVASIVLRNHFRKLTLQQWDVLVAYVMFQDWKSLEGRALDTIGMSQSTSLKLQIAMDRRSKIIQTLSNILKKISNTQDTVIQNLK